MSKSSPINRTLVREMKYLQHVAAFYAIYALPGLNAVAVGRTSNGTMRARLWSDEFSDSLLELVQEEVDYWHDVPHAVGLESDLQLGFPDLVDDTEQTFLMFLRAGADQSSLVRMPRWLEIETRRATIPQDLDWTTTFVVVARAFLGRLDWSVDTASFSQDESSVTVRIRSDHQSARSAELIAQAIQDLDSWRVPVTLSVLDANSVPRSVGDRFHHTFYARPSG